MRKNKMMRAASALLVAVLLTTSVISGTFAKYVTTASAEDTARVAKWGVEIAAWDDSLFSTSYETGNETVVSSTAHKLVAPGTMNDGDGVSFSLTGTPEVSTRIRFTVTATDGTSPIKDVVLPKGTGYKDWTKAPTGTFDLANDYYPVVFTLKDGATKVFEGNLAGLKDKLESDAVSKVYGPGTNLATAVLPGTTGTYTLTWAWDFDGDASFDYNGDNAQDASFTADEIDKADTLLGNIATGNAKYATTGASTDIDFKITITAEQVD